MTMRRKLVLAVIVALVATSAALAGPAKLTVVSRAQFAVRGTGFHPGEHVLVVVVSDGGRASKRLESGTGGGFMARFPSVHIASCGAYTVRATGDEGSRSVLRVMPECPQPLTP